MTQVQSINSDSYNNYDPRVRSPLGTFEAIVAGNTIPIAAAPLSIYAMNNIKKISDLPADKVEIIHNASEKAIQDIGLASKGIKINYVSEVTPLNALEKFMGYVDPVCGAAQGKNAFAVTLKDYYASNQKRAFPNLLKNIPDVIKSGEIYMPEKSLSPTVFHEIGHQMNANMSKIGPYLQKMRTTSLLLPGLIILYGACTQKSKAKDGKELSTGQKIKNFIRDNAGKLSFLAMVPILIEEGMASVKGQKLADKYLTKEIASKTKKLYLIAFSTYAITALTGSLAAYATVKIKDKAIEKKKQEEIDKYNRLFHVV